MDRAEFMAALCACQDTLSAIRYKAHAIHDAVGQTYGTDLPYGFHLDMVADFVKKYGAEVCRDAADAPVIMFGAYFHDAIEDTRLTYNNVMAIAKAYFNDSAAEAATEIAYALTNEKGRTRAERANEKYYAGIRATPYAPLVKLADRLANTAFSKSSRSGANIKMSEVYRRELPHFIESITNATTTDMRLKLPPAMLTELKNM